VCDDKLARIIDARMKLKERWREKSEASPGRADAKPMGSGPANRHGMPQVPPGQHVSKNWPVLDLGFKPEIPTAAWKLTLDGAVEQSVTLDWAAFNALPQVEDESDFHCVTTWSLLDSRWKGVSFSTLAALVQPKASAGFVMAYAADGYTTNVSLEEAMKDDVLLVHTWNGAPLPREHGGPVRMITPQLYAWKGAKWINRLEFMTANKRGFWEERGYSNTAHPWRDDRYS
jgi:DMSO/TMAO reductase YedYZ molybdopterin-dependent catalytic subunit